MNSSKKTPHFQCKSCKWNRGVHKWNQGATFDNQADVGIPGVSSDVLQHIGRVTGPGFLRTKRFPFVPTTDATDSIKIDVITKGQYDNSF